MANQLQRLFSNGGDVETWTPKDGPQRVKRRLRIAAGRKPVQLELSGRVLRLYPEDAFDQTVRDAGTAWILADPETLSSAIAGFVRIGSGETVLVGRANDHCKQCLLLSKPVQKRHLEIHNQGGDLMLTPLDTDGTTSVAAVTEPGAGDIVPTLHRRNLERACDILGRPIELLPPEDAVAAITSVNAILEDEAHRPKDKDGRPGGVLVLPDEPVPVIVGDLHARVDNLLKILSENNFLEEISRGGAYLLFLGDLVHSEAEGQLEDMDSSLLIMDLFVKLKIEFPEHVFCLRGNHESFDEAAGKAGVPQGLLFWERALQLRGQAYVDQLARLFELLPYVAKTDDFIACHAGPPRAEVPFQKLVNISRNPRLALEVTWNRLAQPSRPFGYTKRSVKRFRASLGMAKHAPFIVGHTRLSGSDSVWMNAGEIKNHHVLMSANQHNLAVFVRLGQDMVPLEYTAEPLLSIVNGVSPTGEGRKIEPARRGVRAAEPASPPSRSPRRSVVAQRAG